MSAFRTIVVNGEQYLWKYIFDSEDYQNDSALVIKSNNKNGKLVITFNTSKWNLGYCPFNKGVSATYRGKPVTINLNQPRFVAEIIPFVLNQFHIAHLSGTVKVHDGIELLHKMGYAFHYEKQWNNG